LIKPKAQAPLIVDGYAELTRAVAPERLKPIVGGHPQVFQPGGSVEHLSLSLGDACETSPAGHAPAAKQLGRVFAPECLNHKLEAFNAPR
jgi:hypothetical protein